MTNQSAVTKNSKAYKKSKRKFRKNALAMDYTKYEEDRDTLDKEVEKIFKELKK